MLDALPPRAARAPVLELAHACGALLGPLRTLKCVIIEEARPAQIPGRRQRPPSTSDAENCVWTSDALVFLRALPLRHPVAIAIRDACIDARRACGNGTCSMVSFATRWTALVQELRGQGIEAHRIARSFKRAMAVLRRVLDALALSPDDLMSYSDESRGDAKSSMLHLLPVLADAIQHSDPDLEAWSGRASNSLQLDTDASLSRPSLCVPMRVAAETIRHLVSNRASDLGRSRLDFSSIRVSKIGGVAAHRSRSDIGVSIEVQSRA